MRYLACDDTTLSSNSLTSPVNVLINKTTMEITVRFRNYGVKMDVYRRVVGYVDVLINTFYWWPPTENSSDATTSVTSYIQKFYMCLPAGKYSVTFVASDMSSGLVNFETLFDLQSFLTTDNSSACIPSGYNDSIGKFRFISN